MDEAVADITVLSRDWYTNKLFTQPGPPQRLPRWARHFRRYVPREIEVLEVGTYEGWSALFFLNYLPLAQITCIDSFHDDYETRFDANLAAFEGRVTKVKARALTGLELLIAERRRFHVIYLDAARQRDYVLATSLMAWQLLRPGGVMAWNDYQWGEGKPADKRPHDAINWFLDMKVNNFELIWEGNQMLVRKLEA